MGEKETSPAFSGAAEIQGLSDHLSFYVALSGLGMVIFRKPTTYVVGSIIPPGQAGLTRFGNPPTYVVGSIILPGGLLKPLEDKLYGYEI